jgi:glycosyltransferase involved in cell wall biosynthesis
MNIAMVGLRGIGPRLAGGVERHVEELSVRMARRGHAVTVFGRSSYVDKHESDYHGVRLLRRPAIRTKHLEAITNTLACLPSIVHGYDIVHFHATGPSLLSFVPRLFGRKVVVTVHGLDYLRAKWGKAARAALYAGAWTAGNIPDKTIVVSEKLRRFYREKFRRETWYIPNGVNAPGIRRLDRLGGKFGLEKGEYILSLGRLTPEKGIHYLIPAFRGLDTPRKLVIAGDQVLGGDYVKRLRDLAGDDSRIVFTGALYGEEKDEAFSNALAFVLPSELEGMPIVMLEAMSYGCPVLSSDIEECAEVWETAWREEGIGICRSFRAKDTDDLRRTLGGLLSDPDRVAMGERAREYVLTRYDWDGITDDTLGVYSLALALHKA